MTTSCTSALEMAAMLCDIKPGDEVIMPSFTFVSTSNAFVLRGAKVVFVDIRPDTMNLGENLIEDATTSKSKAIVPVHYAGVSCETNKIMGIAKKYNLKVVEDAAQGVTSSYYGKALGTIGDYGCYNLFWEPTIPNNRSLAIIRQDKGDNNYEKFAKDGIYTKEEVLSLILKHPIDFITSWCNGFLLTVSMHGEHRSILCLFISYTALFLALYDIFKRCKNLKDILFAKTLITLFFISVIIAPCLNHFEARYIIAFQGLFL